MNIQQIKNKAAPILKKHDVVRSSIFGSFATGEAKENSDIDILIKFKGEKSLLDLVELQIKLEETLGRKVDVLTYNSIHPLLKDIILKEAVRIF